MGILYRSAHRLVILLEDIQLIEMEEVSAPASAGFVEDMSREVNKPGLESRARKIFIVMYFRFQERGLAEETQNQSIATAKSSLSKSTARSGSQGSGVPMRAVPN